MFSAALYARVRLSLPYCTRDRGCSAHPAFPAPSFFEGDNDMKTSGASRRENANAYLMFEILNRISASSFAETASPLFGDHVIASVAAENPHGGTAYDRLKIAQMRHGRLAHFAGTRRDVRAV